MNDQPLWPKIVFFDGVCILCNRAVDLLIRIDRRKKLKFASLQSAFAKTCLPGNYQENPKYDSVVFMDESRIYTRSGAVLKVLCMLGFPWNLFRFFFIIPESIRDMMYEYIAKNRYGWFGKRQQCRVLAEDTMDRILG